jgi:phosphohistidine swiveling domain-containing protein
VNSILSFNSTPLPALEQVGGKALALMQMTRAEMPVPPGFVLTVGFFKPWLDTLERSPYWTKLGTTSASELGQTARAIQDLCHTLTFTTDQTNELEQALVSFRKDNRRQLYAVRSSSPDEDLEDASFAGGYETTLGVTRDGIEAAIRHSFASSFDERVFLYKNEHGFQFKEPRIAVIIQQQVEADSAGVAFSLNPLNNCYDEAVINANHGLGESVVDGEAEPDLFVVDKPTRQILEARAGSKQTVIKLNQAGGTEKSIRENHPVTAITYEQAIALTDLVQQVEAHYQKPVDIEWAIAVGKIFLLQARPITTFLPLPPEMLTAPSEPKRLYANSTLIEQGLQEPLSVLGTDFLGYVLNKVGGGVAEGAIGLDGITFTATGGYYMNISHAMMVGMQNAALAPGSFGDQRVLEILDNLDMQEYTRGELTPKLKTMRRKMVFKMLPMMIGVMRSTFRPRSVLEKYQAALPEELHRLSTFNGEGMTLQEQAITLTNLLTFFYGDYGIPMILAGQIAQRRIHTLFKDEAGVRDHLVNIGISLPGNKTAEMGELMYELASADELTCYEDPTHFLSDLGGGVFSPEFTQNWQHFISEFGMRCPGEVDPATPRPKENPAQIFAQLKTMSLSIHGRESSLSYFEESRAKREAAYQALHAIALKKNSRAAKTFEKLYHTWFALGGYRETPKHYVITVVDLFRRSALEIAKRIVAEGRLDAPEQIFDLTIADIDHALVDPKWDLRSLANERTILINKMRKCKLAVRILDSRGKVFYPPRKAAKEGELSGVPISPGMVQGRVKVLQSANEKPLLPGEILVARATDPGWTPLFINAAGIILEIGGALQHGAVVAREYGTPCVSGVDEATSLLKDGQLVEVDGSNGIVRMLDREIPIFQPVSEAETQRQQELQAKREKENTKQKLRQSLMRVIPLLLLPLVLLFIFVFAFTIIKLLMGLSVDQILAQFTDLLEVSKP